MNIFVGQAHVSVCGSVEEFTSVANEVNAMDENVRNCILVHATVVENFRPYSGSLRGIEFIAREGTLATQLEGNGLLRVSGKIADLRTAATAFVFDKDSVTGNHQHIEALVSVDASAKGHVNVLVEIE